jgi:hypothetical protein
MYALQDCGAAAGSRCLLKLDHKFDAYFFERIEVKQLDVCEKSLEK